MKENISMLVAHLTLTYIKWDSLAGRQRHPISIFQPLNWFFLFSGYPSIDDPPMNADLSLGLLCIIICFLY